MMSRPPIEQGCYALKCHSTGSENVHIGYQVGYNNIAVGYAALQDNLIIKEEPGPHSVTTIARNRVSLATEAVRSAARSIE